mgnify:CR=1 FL=1
MSSMGSEFRVGVFALLGIAATVFAVFVISPDLFDSQDRKEFYTILKDASGILPKTHVKTNGVNVGRVKSIKLETNSTRVVMEISEDVEIPVGSTVEIQTVGFLGDKFIEIVRTDDLSKGLIAPQNMIPRAEDTSDLSDVIGIVGSIAKDIKKVTENLAKVLGDEKGERSIQNIVDNIEDLTREAKEILQENREDVRSLVANIESFSKSLDDVLNSKNREKLDRILANFDLTMEDVKGASKNINLISEKIERGDGTIGRLINEDDTLDELEGAIKDIRQALSPVNKLQVEVDYHGELRRDNSSQNYFNLNFHTRPGSYYVLGFTDLTELSRDTLTTTLEDGTVREKIKEEKAIRFNAQIGRRWHWAAVRFGLFESSGGIGGDFYAFSDSFRLTMEAFDFAGQDSEFRSFAHLKAYVSALFYNHIYAIVGVDDPTRKDAVTGEADENLNYFFGAGVSFNDDDLRALFGLAAIAASP